MTKIGLILIALTLVACSKKIELATVTGKTMGTTYSVKFYPSEKVTKKEISKKIEIVLAEVNRQMSTYIKDSEISLYNRTKANTWTKISRDFMRVLKASLDIGEKSSGAFDISMGPLVNLWGFGTAPRISEPPSDAQIIKTKKDLGYQGIKVKGDEISKNKDHLEISLSAIAKGFGVDKVANLLESLNIKSYMVEIGGEVRIGQKKPDDKKWSIGVQNPDLRDKNFKMVLNLENLAIATSGNYQNYFQSNGIRYSHTIDPRTGKPIQHKLASVTILHNEAMIADALATTMMVLGETKGMEYANKHGVPAFFVIKVKDEFRTLASNAFTKLLLDKKI